MASAKDPKSKVQIRKPVHDRIIIQGARQNNLKNIDLEIPRDQLVEMAPNDLERLILTLEEEMHEAATDLRFEYAARLRDEIKELRRELRQFA